MADHDPTPPARWRFDALDARAGMAFASRVAAEDDSADTDVVHFRPPDFQPEFLANGAVALGAARRGFQGGLVIGEAEAAFPSLAALGEFVRRAYVRGAAGDGAPGAPGGGEPPPKEPPPDGTPPEGPEDPGEDDEDKAEPELQRLIDDLADFGEAITRCEPGAAAVTTWRQPDGPRRPWSLERVLAHGAALVVRDTVDGLLRRGRTTGLEYHERIRRLGALLGWMDIDPHEIRRTVERYRSHLDEDAWDHLRRTLAGGNGHRWTPNLDPLTILGRLDAPFRPHATPGTTDLLSWLSRFLATPTDGLDATQARASLERATFAAAVIVARPGARSPWRRFDDPRADLPAAALAWLREHLPRMAYSPAYEATLASVESLRR